MEVLFKVIYITLQAVATAIFHPWFLLVIYFIYVLYKRNNNIEIQNILFTKHSVSVRMIQATLSGILIGILASIILVLVGFPIYLSEYMMFLLPISILLAIINFRYLCFSYSGGILGLLALVFPNINLDISGIIALVGIMHLMESGLIFIEGAYDSIPIVIKKEGKIAAAYMMQKYWPLPFALLVMEITTKIPREVIEMPNWWPIMKNIIYNPNEMLIYYIYPITAILGYGDIAVSTSPEKKSKKTAISLMIYSIVLLSIAVFSPNRIWLQGIGVILMPLLHEILIVSGQRKERLATPIYYYPEKGVRILDLKPEGIGEKIGLKRGDVILKINGIEIEDYMHMKEILNNYYNFIWLDIVEAEGNPKYLEYRNYQEGIKNLGIVPLIDTPISFYNLENIEKSGLLKIFKKIKR
ncbi:PDZ domain-containing protein [Defluviitalea phaphyphila]|uniref:PDZ domain-containing protein n=1 Tax=Defluviitalea phaphyphila TaxID=1473580 RepID=UPI0007311B52|nr:PDZ domain-containing protein [Defluviitalea phaphyphila]